MEVHIKTNIGLDESIHIEVVSKIDLMKSNELIDRKKAIDYWSEFDPMYLEIIEVLKK